MNERIQKLILQAGVSTVGSNGQFTMEEFIAFQEKFAELVEKDVEAKHFSAGFTEGQAEGMESARMLVAQSYDLDMLKETFGVL